MTPDPILYDREQLGYISDRITPAGTPPRDNVSPGRTIRTPEPRNVSRHEMAPHIRSVPSGMFGPETLARLTAMNDTVPRPSETETVPARQISPSLDSVPRISRAVLSRTPDVQTGPGISHGAVPADSVVVETVPANSSVGETVPANSSVVETVPESSGLPG